ncbi:MAG: MqnA/MqnD/SBP family protein [Nitrolancea sp.]
MTTALVAEPLRQGWIEDAANVELVKDLTAETVSERGLCALVGSIDAAILSDRFTVITDVGLTSWHSGAIALWTLVRPDEVDDVMIDLDGVSRTAEAVARATITRFFGMTLRGFNHGDGSGEAIVREHQDAMLEIETGQLNDLIRGWFILSGLPMVTHALVVPNELIENDPDTVRQIVERVRESVRTGVKRRREIRRNLHQLYPVDRDQLVTFHNEQTISLSKTARKGWLDLLRRVGRQMDLPLPETISFLTVGEPDETEPEA